MKTLLMFVFLIAGLISQSGLALKVTIAESKKWRTCTFELHEIVPEMTDVFDLKVGALSGCSPKWFIPGDTKIWIYDPKSKTEYNISNDQKLKDLPKQYDGSLSVFIKEP